MIVGGCELGVERDGALEMLQRLFAPVQYDQQESDLVLDARRLGIKYGGLLPGRECPDSITARFQFAGPGFELLQGLLAENNRRNCDQPENELTEQTVIMEQTEELLTLFRLFCYYRLFRHLSSLRRCAPHD